MHPRLRFGGLSQFIWLLPHYEGLAGLTWNLKAQTLPRNFRAFTPLSRVERRVKAIVSKKTLGFNKETSGSTNKTDV
jgi:hypothetical protein